MNTDELTWEQLYELSQQRKRKRITLCGSSSQGYAFEAVMLHYTRCGYKVDSIGCVKSSDSELLQRGMLTEEDLLNLDLLHFDKMAHSDEVCFINLCRRFGTSTRREYEFAQFLKANNPSFVIHFAEVVPRCDADGETRYTIQFIDDPVADGEKLEASRLNSEEEQ